MGFGAGLVGASGVPDGPANSWASGAWLGAASGWARGSTVVETFVAAHHELTDAERGMLLG